MTDLCTDVVAEETTSEREAVLNMMYGTSDPQLLASAKERTARARSLINDALQSMPPQETAAYYEAVQKIPKLIEIEASPLRYLNFEKQNVSAAAKRFAAYWKHRKALFGKRAWLCMSQTGDGTLSADDLTVLRTGAFALLPPAHNGQPVLCYNRERLKQDFAGQQLILQQRLRCAFYISNVLCQNDAAQQEGIISLAIVTDSFGVDDQDIPFTRTVSMLFQEAFPLRRKCLHVVSRPPRTGRRKFVEIVFPQVSDYLARLATSRDCVHNVGHSRQEVMDGLQAHGFDKEGVPRILGGTYNYYSELAEWNRQRVLVERAVCAALDTSGTGSSGADRMLSAVSILREGKNKKKKRSMDALYARRKRDRRKIEVEVFQEQVDALTIQKTQLQTDQLYLESLLKAAESEVHRYMVGDAHTTFVDSKRIKLADATCHQSRASLITASESSALPFSAKGMLGLSGIPNQTYSPTESSASVTFQPQAVSFLGHQQNSRFIALESQLSHFSPCVDMQLALLAYHSAASAPRNQGFPYHSTPLMPHTLGQFQHQATKEDAASSSHLEQALLQQPTPAAQVLLQQQQLQHFDTLKRRREQEEAVLTHDRLTLYLRSLLEQKISIQLTHGEGDELSGNR